MPTPVTLAVKKLLLIGAIGSGVVGCKATPNGLTDADVIDDAAPLPDVGLVAADASDVDATPACSDPCTSEGASRCSDAFIEVCTDRGDNCVEWSSSVNCADTNDQCDDSDAEAVCVIDCELQPTYPFTASVVGLGTGMISSNPAGISCGLDCTQEASQNCAVELNATPDSNSSFLGWSGDCTGTGSCTLLKDSSSAAAVVANFESTTTPLWSSRFGNIWSDEGQRIAVDSSGNVFIAGTYQQTINFGGSPLPNHSDSTDVFVAKFSASGEHLWSIGVGGDSTERLTGMSVDSSDDVVITGTFYDVVDLGGGAITAVGTDRDFYVAKYAGADGSHVWSNGFGGVSDDRSTSVATDSANNVYVTGSFRSIMNFGGGIVTPTNFDVFVAKYSGSDGSYVWARQYGSVNIDRGYAIEVDAMDDILLLGRAATDIDFGGGLLATTDVSSFLVKLDGETAAHIWSVDFAPTVLAYPVDMQLDSSGDAYVVGYFGDTVAIAGATLTSHGSSDTYVARFSGANGSPLWAKSYGGSSIDTPAGIHANDAGTVAVIGTFRETADFGVGALSSAGGSDVVVLTLNATGTELSATRYGGDEHDSAGDMIMRDDGSWFVTAAFRSALDVGGGVLTSAGITDVVLAAFAP